MKLSTVVALATILGTTALPAMGLAQGKGGRGKGGNERKQERGHPDNGNDKNRGRGNAFGVDKNRRPDPRRNDDRKREDDRRREELRRNEERRRADLQRRNSNTGSLQAQSDRRQQTKNEWRNIALASGALAVYGLLKKDNTLTFAGAAGALYSLNRYEQDRKSQSAIDRARASYFSRDYFVRDGVRYNRRTMVKNGQKNYQFYRVR